MGRFFLEIAHGLLKCFESPIHRLIDGWARARTIRERPHILTTVNMVIDINRCVPLITEI